MREPEEDKINEEPPDYELWLNKPCWDVNEICCLAKGFDPDHVFGELVVDLDSGEIKPAPKNYRAIVIVAEVNELIRRAIESGELKPAVSGGNCFKPLTAITYLNQKGVVLPSELLTVLPEAVAAEKKGVPPDSKNEEKRDSELDNENLLETNKQSKPWLIRNPDDPKPLQRWYIPARYFARLSIEEDPTLLRKRNLLAIKVAKLLKSAGIYKRGGKLPLDSVTVKKAFTNVKFG